jgi:Fungalysin/Thermolysin Propeptide Motif
MKRMMTGILFLLFSLPALAQTECDHTVQLITRALPATVGNAEVMRGLLAPAVSSEQLSDRFDPAAVTRLVGDELAPECCDAFRPGTEDYECTYVSTGGSGLRIALAGGSVIYTNRARSENKQPTSVPAAASIDVARRAATAFGVPEPELGAPDFRYVRLTTSNAEATQPDARSFRVEGHVRYRRTVGGVPVAFSNFHVALDARGQIARVHVRWPDFALIEGLDVSQMLTREEVLASIVEEVLPAARCGSLSGVTAKIVYAKASLIDGPETSESDAYAPALLVSLIPVEQAEDSGIPQMPVQNLVFPLLGGSDR